MIPVGFCTEGIPHFAAYFVQQAATHKFGDSPEQLTIIAMDQELRRHKEQDHCPDEEAGEQRDGELAFHERQP